MPDVFFSEIYYTKSTGGCRGGNSPANEAGKAYYDDRNCKDRCGKSETCTGYMLPVAGSNWCQTFTSAGATGNGKSSYECFMKQKGTLFNVNMLYIKYKL